MLYSIFLYQTKSGLLIYEKSFQDISSGKMELFSSFFSAIKSFVAEMISEGNKELKNIGIGDYTILVTTIGEINADLVVIADQEDKKKIHKLIPKLIKILMKHQQLFLEWDGNMQEFSILDQPLSELILSNKKLLQGTNLLEKPEEFLQSMWEHKGNLSEQLVANLKQERDFLINRIDQTDNVQRKLAITEKVLELSEKLKDNEGFLKYQKQVKTLKDEIKDLKLKLDYYLRRTKESLSSTVDTLGSKSILAGDYKDTYLNLYSFSTKLKHITASGEWDTYRKLAQTLIDKEEYDEEEINNAISTILKMSDNVEDYVPQD